MLNHKGTNEVLLITFPPTLIFLPRHLKICENAKRGNYFHSLDSRISPPLILSSSSGVRNSKKSTKDYSGVARGAMGHAPHVLI